MIANDIYAIGFGFAVWFVGLCFIMWHEREVMRTAREMDKQRAELGRPRP